MYPNWNQKYISGHTCTRSSTVTHLLFSQLGEKGTRKNPSRQAKWGLVRQTIIGSKWNVMSGKRE